MIPPLPESSARRRGNRQGPVERSLSQNLMDAFPDFQRIHLPQRRPSLHILSPYKKSGDSDYGLTDNACLSKTLAWRGLPRRMVTHLCSYVIEDEYGLLHTQELNDENA